MLERRRALGKQLFAHRRRAGKRHLAHQRVRSQHAADGFGPSRNDIEHTWWKARSLRQLGQRQCRKRCLRRRLRHHRAARSQGRARLARQHCSRKIPRRNQRCHAHRLAQGEHAPVRPWRRHHVAVDAPCLLGEPLDETRRVFDLAARLGQRLALLGHHDGGEIVAVLQDQVEPAAQQLRAGLCRRSTPARKCSMRCFNRMLGVDFSATRHITDAFGIGRIVNSDVRIVGGIPPFAAD